MTTGKPGNQSGPSKDDHRGNPISSTTESIKQYSADLNKAYADIENSLMDRIHEGNRQRFRVYLLGTILAIVWTTAVFGEQLRKMLSDQTADIARETLENELIKVQTNELATAVVQTILNDKEITANAARFLQEAAAAPETQQALLSLTLHILQHADTLKEVNLLVKHLVDLLSKDPVRLHMSFLSSKFLSLLNTYCMCCILFIYSLFYILFCSG